VAHLNSYLGSADSEARQKLTARDVAGFFKQYPSFCRNRGPLENHLSDVRHSVHRFVAYLEADGRFDRLVARPIYQSLLDSYLDWMRQHQHATEGTLDVRKHSITRFLAWLGPQATSMGLGKLTANQVEKFIIAYAEDIGRAGRHSMQSALRTFMRFGLHAGHFSDRLDLAVPTLRTYKLATVPRGLNAEQACQILASIDRRKASGRRDYAILQLLYNYGVRGGQVRGLRLDDIQWARNRILFRALKHGKDSLLPLTASVGGSLLDYLKTSRPPSDRPEIFLTCRAPYRPLSQSSNLAEIVCRHIRVSGLNVPCRGAHAFRHGFATRMVAEGHSLKAVADVLGHRHLSTTFLYTKVDFAALQQVALEWPQEGIT
jgi:site-specific recombinase XerD